MDTTEKLAELERRIAALEQAAEDKTPSLRVALMLRYGMSRTEAQIIATLAESPGEHVSVNALMKAVNDDGPRLAEVESLRVAICRIRKKIAHTGATITHRHGLGYRLQLASGLLQTVVEKNQQTT